MEHGARHGKLRKKLKKNGRYNQVTKLASSPAGFL